MWMKMTTHNNCKNSYIFTVDISLRGGYAMQDLGSDVGSNAAQISANKHISREKNSLYLLGQSEGVFQCGFLKFSK